MATFRVALVLSALLLFAPFSALSSASEGFSDSHETGSFPVGWQNILFLDHENDTHWSQIYYPANESGLGQPIANTSGPYPLLIWIGDEGESNDQYDWLGKEIATAGYITVVLPPDWNSDQTGSQCGAIMALWGKLFHNNQNGSFGGDPANMQDAFDLNYWGIGGHGVGAKQAAHCQLIMTGEWNPYIDTPVPTALIGLGLEDANTDLSNAYLGASPEPGMGLYLTGTLDNIAKADTNIDRWLANHEIPWHYMSVIGGNHIQYQDESGFWEGFNDGSATISREDQQAHAIEHIVPYLDLMLKGDHTQWLNATNREVNWQTPSDSNSYIYEDLSGARFMPMVANSSDVTEMEGLSGRVVSVSTQLTHRNGALPIGTSVTCTIMEGGDWWDPMDYSTYGINATGAFTGSVNNGSASATDCEVSTEGVPPGNRSLRVDVDWYGMPSYLDIDFFRENQEPVIASPLPAIEILQHGSASMPYSDFAVDPDGTSLIVEMQPHLPSTNQMHCFLEVSSITCEHTGEAEWAGMELLNLTIFDRYDSNFSTQFNLSAFVLPVDDSVVQISPIPPLYLEEDDSQQAVVITSHFEDPEGENSTIINASSEEGLDILWTANNLAITPQLNWHGSTVVDVWVGDGTSAPISATFSVHVESKPDLPRLNLTRISLVEDTPFEIPLSELGWDEDGELVEFEITGSHPHLTTTVLTNVLRIVPASDWSGLSTGWNITVVSGDGNVTGPIEFEVSEVNDPVQLTWGPLEVVGNDTVFIVAIHDPDDATPWTARSRWNGQVWTEFETNCAASDVSVEHPQDWECTVSTDYSTLQPGAHRLEVQFYEEGQWTEEKIYYHTVLAPEVDTSDGNNLPEIPVDTGSETFSIWIVFAIVIASIVGLIGLYMIITLSKDDMEEMLGRPSKAYDDSDELEIEIVDID
jgi:hypothetical protein